MGLTAAMVRQLVLLGMLLFILALTIPATAMHPLRTSTIATRLVATQIKATTILPHTITVMVLMLVRPSAQMRTADTATALQHNMPPRLLLPLLPLLALLRLPLQVKTAMIREALRWAAAATTRISRDAKAICCPYCAVQLYSTPVESIQYTCTVDQVAEDAQMHGPLARHVIS